MKKLLSYIFTLTIVAMYIVSTMGYGIHECTHDGTKDVVVLFGETPCEYIHSHIDGDGHIYVHSHNPAAHGACALSADSPRSCRSCGCEGKWTYKHDDNCCHTTVYSITHDQTIEDNADIVVPCVYIDFALLYPSVISADNLFPGHIGENISFRQIYQGWESLCISNRTLRV